MTEADAMAKTFFHTCTISRQELEKDGAVTRPKIVEMYKDVPCAVSTGGGSGARKGDEYMPVEYQDTLYTRPEVDVKAGDVVTATIYGETYEFEAGEGRRYPSHRQTPLMRKERA